MISRKLSDNERTIRQQCAHCDDVNIRPFSYRGHSALIVFLETTANTFDISDIKPIDTMEAAITILMAGNAVFFLEGSDKAYKISSQGYPNRGVTESEMEKVLRGSQEGYSDSVKTNVAITRKRLRTTRLKVVEQQLGDDSHTTVSILYMEGLIPKGLLQTLKRRLSSIRVSGVMDSGVIEHLAEERWFSPFPRFQTTQRPDRAAQELLEGRILLLCDNSPVGLLLPSVFPNFMEASEDRYNKRELVHFVRGLRYLALVIALLLPGYYLAAADFHTQLLPVNLLLSIAQARQGVPFPSIVEILSMELSFELIREAGVRMPGPLGGTIGIVGGLIIGQAAVSANLVSPIVVVIVALTALSSFAIPNDEFAGAIRLLKYGFILLGGLLGIFGMILGLFILVYHLAGLVSFKIPYMIPAVCKEKKHVR